jgi:excisionase family DNA binding protein
LSGAQTEMLGQNSPYMDYEGAARYTGLSRQTLWRYVRDGRLRICGPRSARRFRPEDLDQFMREVASQ